MQLIIGMTTFLYEKFASKKESNTTLTKRHCCNENVSTMLFYVAQTKHGAIDSKKSVLN